MFNYAEENPAILSKNYGNGSSKQQQQQEMEGVSGESYRNAQRKIEGGVAAAAAFKLQSTGFDTLGQAKNIYLKETTSNHMIYYLVLVQRLLKQGELLLLLPAKKVQFGPSSQHYLPSLYTQKELLHFFNFFIPTVSRHEGTNFSLD